MHGLLCLPCRRPSHQNRRPALTISGLRGASSALRRSTQTNACNRTRDSRFPIGQAVAAVPLDLVARWRVDITVAATARKRFQIQCRLRCIRWWKFSGGVVAPNKLRYVCRFPTIPRSAATSGRWQPAWALFDGHGARWRAAKTPRRRP